MLKKIGLSVLAVPVLLLGLATHPAQARSHVAVQFGVGYPVYSYPYNAYDYYGYPYVTYYRAPRYVETYPRAYWVGRHGHMHYYHNWR